MKKRTLAGFPSRSYDPHELLMVRAQACRQSQGEIRIISFRKATDREARRFFPYAMIYDREA